jgi:hypothetical protein
MIPNLPVAQKQTEILSAEQRMALHLDNLKETENILRRVAHMLLVASTRLPLLVLEDRSLYVASIRAALKDMDEALMLAERVLLP